MNAQDYVCKKCNVLFPPRIVTNKLNSAWRVLPNKKLEELKDMRIVRCTECLSAQKVPKINSVEKYLEVIEDLIPFHLLDSPWIEKYLSDGEVRHPLNSWNIEIG